MNETYTSGPDAVEPNRPDYSSLVRASYEQLFVSLLTPKVENEAPELPEQNA